MSLINKLNNIIFIYLLKTHTETCHINFNNKNLHKTSITSFKNE